MKRTRLVLAVMTLFAGNVNAGTEEHRHGDQGKNGDDHRAKLKSEPETGDRRDFPDEKNNYALNEIGHEKQR